MTLRRGLLILALLLPGLGVILAMIGSVFFIAVMQSFGYYNFAGEDVFSLEHWQDVLGRRAFRRALQYSAYVAIISSLGSVLIAYPLAIWLRKPFRGSMVVSSMLKAPYFVPGLVAAFLFLNIVAFHGVLNQFLMWIGLIDAPIRFQNDRNAIGLLFLQIWKNLPLALLLLTGAVQSISDEVLDAARDLGAGVFDRFRKVIAPLTVSAMQAALVIIFIGAAGDFAFQVTVGPTNVQSMAQHMVFLKNDRGDWNEAAAVGVALMGLALTGSLILAALSRFVLKGGKW